MKVRTGFVSNSSSSSFIVNKDLNVNHVQSESFGNRVYRIGSDGLVEFGWGVSDEYDTDAKINFSYLMAKYFEDDEKIDMLKEVILEHYNDVEEVVIGLTEDYRS